MLIFLSGPISNGETLIHETIMQNVRSAERIMFSLIDKGWAVYTPHLHYRALFDHGVRTRWDWRRWMAFDKVFLDKSDALYYMTPGLYGESKGSAQEVAYAREIEIPVYMRINDVPEATND